MAQHYENDFKVMIVELLKSGRKAKEVSEEYGLNDSMITYYPKIIDRFWQTIITRIIIYFS